MEHLGRSYESGRGRRPPSADAQTSPPPERPRSRPGPTAPRTSPGRAPLLRAENLVTTLLHQPVEAPLLVDAHHGSGCGTLRFGGSGRGRRHGESVELHRRGRGKVGEQPIHHSSIHPSSINHPSIHHPPIYHPSTHHTPCYHLSTHSSSTTHSHPPIHSSITHPSTCYRETAG